jgi:hypothetical protein
LQVRRYDQTSDLTLGLFDVSTPASALVATRFNAFDAAVFADLGSGVSYGVFDVADGAGTDILSLGLDLAAIADVQSAADAGRYFSIGAAVEDAGYIFGASVEEPGNSGGFTNSIQLLVIDVEPAATAMAEPATAALVGPALVWLTWVCHRRRARCCNRFQGFRNRP